MKRAATILGSTLLLAGLLGFAAIQPEKKPTPQPAPETKAAAKADGDPYPLATCPISGKKLGEMGSPVLRVYGAGADGAGGREVRFCCDKCPARFESDPAKSFAKLDAEMTKDQAPLYPLTTSLVSGDKLPEKPVEFIYCNRLVRVGSEAEKATFLKDTKTYLKKLNEAVIAAQGKNYPLDKCPVSHEEFGGSMGEPVDIVRAGRLIRLCCKSCKADLDQDPAAYIAQVDEARAKAKK